jgi:ATP-binding cassette subfamily B protein
MSYLFRVFPYLKPHKGLAVTTIVAVTLIAGASLLAPWPMKILVDSVLGDHPLPSLLEVDYLTRNVYLLMIVVVSAGFLMVLLQGSLNVLRDYVNTKLKLKITLDFRGDLFQHAQRLSLAYHDSTYSGKLVYLLNNQTDAVAGLLMTLPVLAQALMTFIGMFVILVILDRQLALTALAVLPFLFFSVRSYAARVQGPLHNVKELEGQTLSMIQEAMSMLRIIVAFGRERHELRRFRSQGEEAINARVDVTMRQSFFDLTVNLITAAGLALVVGVGAAHILAGTLTVGELLVVMAYMSSVYQSLGTISSTAGTLQDQVVSLQRAFVMLDTEPDVRDRRDAEDVGDMRGDVVFKDVFFSYGRESETLQNLSFEVKAGEYVAIVGPTGAGKTTLVSLIPRFYDPDRGRILIDGNDSFSYTLESLRRHISIVGQEPILFVGSIADNIRYGNLDASDEDIVRAARAANAHEFIMQLPRQYETETGERGARLSGGERQRIAVARAFLKDSPILILDEPTAFIDPKTERVVLDALHELRQGRTVFMISHRIATIRDADRILVLNEGHITEMGTHAELSALNGLYRQLDTIQSG